MNFVREFTIAVRCYFKALDFIRENRLWNYLLIPGIFNLLVFIGIGVLAFYYSGWLISYLNDLVGMEPDTGLNTVIHFLLALLIRIITFLIYLKIYRYTVLILLAPVLALLSEKLYYANRSDKPTFHLSKFFANALRGVLIAVTNLLRELMLTGAFLLMAFLLPVIAFLVPPIIFFIESYHYGFSMFDYFNEQQGMSAIESRREIWNHSGQALGNGLMFNLILIIPVIGVMTAPVIALTSAYLTLEQHQVAPD